MLNFFFSKMTRCVIF